MNNNETNNTSVDTNSLSNTPVTPTEVPNNAVQTPVEPVPVATPTPSFEPVAPVNPATNGIQMNPVEQPMQPMSPQPNGTPNIPKNIKGLGKGPIIAISAVVAILVIGVIISVVASSPKSVFKNAVNLVYKGTSTAIDGYEKYLNEYDLTKNAIEISGDISFATNSPEMSEYDLKDLKLGFNTGVDYKNEIISVGASLSGKKEKITVDAQLLENEMYLVSSLFKETIKIDSDLLSDMGLDVELEDLKEELEAIQDQYDTDPETYEFIVKTIKNAINKSLDSKYMEKENDEIEVLNKKIKVKKYSYIIDDAAAQEFTEKVAEYLLEAKDFDENLAKALGVKKSDVKDLLKEIKKSAKDIEFKGKFAINLYTKGLLNTPAGFGFEIKGKEYVSCYTDGKNFEMTVDNHASDEYSASKFVITAKQDGKGYKVEAKENKETIMTINFKEITQDTIDASVTMFEDGKETVEKVDFYFSFKDEKTTLTGEYKFKITDSENVYVGFNGKYTLTIKDELNKMSIKDTIDIEELDMAQIGTNIENITEKDETLGALIEDAVSELEKEMLDLDSNGMLQIYSVDLDDVFANTNATVLFVGDSYYLDDNNTNMLNDLKKLQSELNFYSYYYPYYLAGTELYELTKDVEHICPTGSQVNEENIATCNQYPVLYLIKDGKVQKAFRQSVTYDELKAALAEIGIE